MPNPDRNAEKAVREAAYFIWEREGRPEGQAQDHWGRAIFEKYREDLRRDDEPVDDEEKILFGRPDVNMPALLTRDVRGG
jgi:Protein of unknown function (DUF2934)